MNTEKKINAIMRYIVADSREEKNVIMEEIKAMVEPVSNEKRSENIEDVISEILFELGMPSHILGYQYSVYAIKIAVENHDIINAITCELYPTVAEHCGTTESRVERAIRNGIECAWNRCDIDVIEKYFGNTVSPTKGKPTNSEFIALIADKLQLQLKSGSVAQM